MHSEYVICPVEVMLKDGSLDAGERCPREDPVVDDVVLPTDGMESLELFLLELLQIFDVSTILSLCFTSVQKNGESYIPEDRDFYSYVEAVIAEDLVQECSIDSMSLFVPVVKVSFAGEIIQDVIVPRLGNFSTTSTSCLSMLMLTSGVYFLAYQT